MSHSTNIRIGDHVWYAHYNGDFSGEVRLVVSDGSIDEELPSIPAAVFRRIVADMIRSRKVEALEAMSDDALLFMTGALKAFNTY